MTASAEQHRAAYAETLGVPVLPIRLRSRSVIWTIDPGPLQDGNRIGDRWRESWLSNVPVHGYIVDDASAVPYGFDLKRREWVILNRFRSSQGKCTYLMHRWGYSKSSVCNCGFAQQTTTYILDCPLRPFKGGLTVLHQVSSEAVVYLKNLDVVSNFEACKQQYFSFHVIRIKPSFQIFVTSLIEIKKNPK
jgi:hypothetical protein